ncbi:Cytochrome P450 monooxygenase paxP [Apiospora rasikravindrae]|uniref:Cytochrome P450 monooxygenase paxP n=1 Tax=Apiospora rasikravindrae TaxID=990691 RepID=A0ABR1SLG4_9PEZI
MEIEQLSHGLSDRLPALVSVALFTIAVYIVSSLWNEKSTFPLLGADDGNATQRRKEYMTNAAKLYQKGYEIFRHQAYRMTTLNGERIVVPLEALEELRSMPDDVVDNVIGLNREIESKYTGLVNESGFAAHMVRSDLTRSLNRINPELAAEAEQTVHEVLGPCDDWTPQVAFNQLLRVVAIVSGRIFLGPDLCRREEYIYASTMYTVDVFKAVRKLKAWNQYLRPIVQYFIPELKTLVEHRRKARAFLAPVIEERKEAMKNGGDLSDDMLQWMMNKAESNGVSDGRLAELQLDLSLAAIHTTTMAVTDILCDIVIRPDLVDELRAEIKQVMGNHDGVLTTQALYEMKLLDSVMRESQRWNPISQSRFPRYIAKPVTLKDGTQIPAGMFIETAIGPVNHDPKLYPEPDVFDPYRFHDLRNATKPDPINYKTREQYQFVTVTKENMGFGYGKHACPGRFFAANEIKLIMIHILLQYNLRMPNGATERYSRVVQGAHEAPNPTIKIEFKRVQSTT